MRWSLFIITLALSGCGGFVYHGKYCGPGRPKAGERPPVQDDLDVVCRDHDDCYASGAEPKYTCDLTLVRSLLSLSLNPQCENTAREMAVYFANLQPLGTPAMLDAKAKAWGVTAAEVVRRGGNIVAEGRASKTAVCCDRRAPPSPDSPCAAQQYRTPLRLRMMQALTRWHDVEGLYFEAEIPESVKRRALRTAGVPPAERERIIAIASSPGDALVFTESGVFFGQLIGGHGYLTYAELSRAYLANVDDDTVALGSRRFRFADWPPGALYGILRTFRERGSISDTDHDLRGLYPYAESPTIAAQKFDGTWRGPVNQKGAPSYSVVLSIRASRPMHRGAALGKVDYPEIGCGGSITLIDARETTLRVAEVLTYGTRTCMVGGEMTLELKDDDNAAWSWTTETGRHHSSATIVRDH